MNATSVFPDDQTTDSEQTGAGVTLGETDGFTLGGDAGGTFGERDRWNLAPAADGPLVVRAPVARTREVIVGAKSLTGQTFNASVRWIADDDPAVVFQELSASDVGLSAATDDDARLTRYGPVVEVTYTTAEGPSIPNPITAFVDATA
jgi:hypothetical protein